AAAFATHVGVIELEALVEALSNEIELSAVKVDKTFGVDDNLDAMTVEHRIFGRRLVNELERVRQPGTTGGAHTQPHTNPLAPPFERAAHMLDRSIGHADSHRNLL